uniref:HIT-type domain-containing protein n=1 Tax=Strongyloides papillosus TaxID=174720 RepID=A0A0N5BFG4_STREA
MLDLKDMNLEEKDCVLLCQICNKNKHKYRCPKCQFKTCSLVCCKQHKEEYNCDGVKPPFVSVSKFSDFTDEKSIEDQKFLHNLSQNILNDRGHGQKRKNYSNINCENHNTGLRKNKEQKLEVNIDNEDAIQDQIDVDINNDEEKNTNYLNNQEKQLVSNCHKKRIWLQYDESKNFEGSRYESYSDVINWSIKLEFVKEFNDDGSMKIEKKEDINRSNSKTNFIYDSENLITKEELNLETNEVALDKDTEFPETTQKSTIQETSIESKLIDENQSINVNNTNECGENTSDKEILSPLEEGECEESDDEPPEEISSKVIPVEEDTKTEHSATDETNVVFFDDTKKIENKEIGRFTYIARNIVESIKVSTLIKQFIKPKPYGVVVSKSELDDEVMSHFIAAGMDNIIVYMKVPFEDKERYYVIDINKSILDNLRNRYILNVPTFVITLNTECSKIKTLSEIESLELHEYFKGKRNRHVNGGKQHNNQNHDRNNFNRRNFNRNQRGRSNNRRGKS